MNFFQIAIVAFVTLLPLLTRASPIQSSGGPQYIQLGGNSSTCLGVPLNNLGSGTLLEIVSCDCTGYGLQWNIVPWYNSQGISLAGGYGDYCLDAGTAGENITPMKVWQCYPGELPQQAWYFNTQDGHISVTAGAQSLDSGFDGQNYHPQTYQYVGGNTNQQWSIQGAPAGNPSEAHVSVATYPAVTSSSVAS